MNKYPKPTSMDSVGDRPSGSMISNRDQCCENTLADMRRDALRQYDEMATKANHWSSFISHAIQSFVPKRQAVYNAINSERDYQDEQVKNSNRKDMVDLNFGSTLSAIRYNLELANKYWYSDSEPYVNTMKYLRKVAALVVQCGEKYGMEGRVPISESIDNSLTIENDCVKSACVTSSPYGTRFTDRAVGPNPDKCLKIVTSEQKAYNDIIDEIVKSKTESITKLINQVDGEGSVSIEGNLLVIKYSTKNPHTTERIKAIISVISSLIKSKIKV